MSRINKTTLSGGIGDVNFMHIFVSKSTQVMYFNNLFSKVNVDI